MICRWYGGMGLWSHIHDHQIIGSILYLGPTSYPILIFKIWTGLGQILWMIWDGLGQFRTLDTPKKLSRCHVPAHENWRWDGTVWDVTPPQYRNIVH